MKTTDVLVRNLAGRAELVVKLGESLFVGRDVGRQKLQRDRMIEREVVSAVHLAHASTTEEGNQPLTSGDD